MLPSGVEARSLLQAWSRDTRLVRVEGGRLRRRLIEYYATDGRGDQPIHHAARNGDTEIVRLLLDHGAGANARNARGHTVLYCAGGHGHLESLELLLERGADPHEKFTADGKALLEWLAQYPGDPRYQPITAALKRHLERAGR